MKHLSINEKTPWKLPREVEEYEAFWPPISKTEWEILLRKAEDGDPETQWEVASRYYEGCNDEAGRIIARRSAQKAAQWFQKSAENGYPGAQCTLGVMLGDGDGIKRDYRLAIYWLKKALTRGYAGAAANNIAITYRDMGNLRRAFHWFKKSVATGRDDDAFIQLGVHYFWGKGVRKDYAKAVSCFRTAVQSENITESGRDDAYFYLALAYIEGNGVTKSMPTARKLLKRANKDNDHPAARALLRDLKGRT